MLYYFPQLDLTPNLPQIIMVSYFLMLIAIVSLMMHMHTLIHMYTCEYSFFLVEVPITVSMLLVSTICLLGK